MINCMLRKYNVHMGNRFNFKSADKTIVVAAGLCEFGTRTFLSCMKRSELQISYTEERRGMKCNLKGHKILIMPLLF